MINSPFPLGTYLLLILAAFFSAISFVIAKHVVDTIPPLAASAIRFSMAGFFMIVLAFIKDRRLLKQQIIKNGRYYIVLGLLGIAGFNSLLFMGLTTSSAVNASMIMATNPLLTIILAAWILGDPITPEQKWGSLVSLIGVFIVISKGQLANIVHLNLVIGDVLILAANFCWAFYCVAARHYVKTVPPLISVGITMCVGAIMLSLLSAGNILSLFSTDIMPQCWAELGFLAFFGSILVYLFWNIGFKKVGVATTSVFFNLIPIMTVILVGFIGVLVDSAQLIGGGVILLGVSITVLKLPIKLTQGNQNV